MTYELELNLTNRKRGTMLKLIRQNHEEQSEGCPDEEIWEQEYCCKFISDASSWITWDQIVAAESGFATIELPDKFIPVGELYLGVDIGRGDERSESWGKE